MKIDFCSDLHVDAWFHETKLHDPTRPMHDNANQFIHIDWEILKDPESKILIIAGDTANNMITTSIVAKQAASWYDHVVIVDGNHEHYQGDDSVEDNMNLLRMLLSQSSNIAYLDNNHPHLEVDGVAFVGATGWYDFKAFENRGIPEHTAKMAWSAYSNDSRYPNYGVYENPQKLAQAQAVGLATTVNQLSQDDTIKEIVMVTHMSPSAELMEWKPNNVGWNALTPSYVNTGLSIILDSDLNHKIKNWVYGHTHYRQRVTLNGVTYLNNARGYPRENPPFNLTSFTVSE